jgi:hypothetical protein
MDAKTLDALKGSIAKWDRIADGTGANHGPRNCPLCKLFWHRDAETRDVNCDSACPVKQHTGLDACEGTPYDRYENEEDEEEALAAALAEAEFLRGLLPKETP